jgi:hypothetical protein
VLLCSSQSMLFPHREYPSGDEISSSTCRISRRRVDDRVVRRYTGRLWTESIIIIIIISSSWSPLFIAKNIYKVVI